MTIEEWTTAYILRFGEAQAFVAEHVEGEADFLRQMANDVHSGHGQSAIILINMEIRKRRGLRRPA